MPDSSFADEAAMDVAVEGVGEGEARYWVTAQLSVPEIPTIKGEVAT